MTFLSDSILHLSEYQVVDATQTDDGFHFHVEALKPVAYEGYGVNSGLVGFGKRDIP